MINKDRFLEIAISKFTRFGCKRFTLDDLAHEMGISKKTIYENFDTKETIVNDSLDFLLKKIELEIIAITTKKGANPILSIIEIYRIGFLYVKSISPTYINGLRKYYPKSNTLYSDFKLRFTHTYIKGLLVKAQKSNLIKATIDIDLTCDLYFGNLENLSLIASNLYEKYTVDEILEHLIITYLRGIVTEEYLKENDLLIP
ncbi:TetR/AcrR family transcriptional regulator [Cellulophaga sp. E16_2]|uniref:TetR/AcrR family transcriptional regulator n=1 Tax=Cellulophaga sp. E16_2 TaxID=2789297 RepID=UPI001A9228B8|nr:TetR/AcrR family transcriptional regulator [Cellulophaga sp. E16_2]MBO0590993.1 TetR/AcrR family transcriptional regulator [Cellulophaga sp. E16_2]